jgi:OOP family OmpA-OmpF porin
MKKLFAILLAASSTLAVAHDNWTSASGQVWKNSTGQCWRNSAWTPATTALECNGAVVAPAVPAVPAVPAAPKAEAPTPTAVKVNYAADTLFDFDKSVLKPAGKQALDSLAGKISNMSFEVAIVIGHTDSVGTEEYNLKLGSRRAAAVKAFLISKGVPAARIYTDSKGEKQPVASNKTKEGRAKNRRVEIEVVGTTKY